MITVIIKVSSKSYVYPEKGPAFCLDTLGFCFFFFFYSETTFESWIGVCKIGRKGPELRCQKKGRRKFNRYDRFSGQKIMYSIYFAFYVPSTITEEKQKMLIKRGMGVIQYCYSFVQYVKWVKDVCHGLGSCQYLNYSQQRNTPGK